MFKQPILFILTIIIYSCASTVENETPATYAQKARAAFHEAEFEESLDYIQAIEKSKTKLSDELYVIKAVSLQNIDKEVEAQVVLEAGQKLYPYSRKINIQLANSSYQQQKYPESLNALKRAYPKAVTDLPIAKLFLKNYLILKQNRQAMELADSLMEKNMDDVELRYYRGLSSFRMKEYAKAAEDLRFCYHKDFQQDKMAKYLAFIHVNLKNVDKANYYIRHLALKTPDDAFTQKMFLRNLLNISSVDRISTLKVFLTFIEDDYEQYELVKALYEKDYVNEAIDVLAGLHEEDPTKIWVALNYSKILVKNNQHEQASVVLAETMKHWGGSEKTMLQSYQAKIAKIKEIEAMPDPSLANAEHAMAPKGDTILGEDAGRTVANTIPVEQPAAVAVPVNDLRTDFVDYEVKKGEFLVEISKRFYGTEAKWMLIQSHNKPHLDDPYNIPIGTKIKVPVSP
ncbi:MAG: LysM peptidoglycan-binding domain-containing protein [Bacteriovoracaceae bacterium]|nr:LysM peptidoglycan-binding domain-containing protein [Bacteriovoracaceae bacterium]